MAGGGCFAYIKVLHQHRQQGYAHFTLASGTNLLQELGLPRGVKRPLKQREQRVAHLQRQLLLVLASCGPPAACHAATAADQRHAMLERERTQNHCDREREVAGQPGHGRNLFFCKDVRMGEWRLKMRQHQIVGNCQSWI